MKVHIHTLGCKVNQYESQALEMLLRARGHEICPRDGDFDVFIVNTCAVTAESGRKSRQIIRQLKASHPNALCAVCGCYSQISPEEAEKLGAQVIYGSGDRLKFIEDLEKAYNTGDRSENVDDPMKRRKFEFLPSGNIGTRTRATLKVQDGCSNFCTYCVIPYARGPVRSLPIGDAAAEAKKLKADGYKEIVITGIEIASWGKDLKTGQSLEELIAAVAEAAGGVRIGLGSLEPRVVTENFCRKLASIPHLCPHFHLSLQSGCDSVLKRMNRKYDTRRFYQSVELLREYFPHCGITADLITGFPGETQEEFEETLDFIKKCRFSDMHVFPYSKRPGTKAAAMKDQIPNAVKHQRAAKAIAVAENMQRDYLESCLGHDLSVLFETEKDGYMTGHAENYVKVTVRGSGLRNQVLDVMATEVIDGGLFGEILEK